VSFSACEGDEPGLQMNPLPLGKGLGLIPVSSETSRACKTPIATRQPSRLGQSVGGRTQRWLRLCRWLKISFDSRSLPMLPDSKSGPAECRAAEIRWSIMDIHKLYDLDEVRALGGSSDYTVGPAGSRFSAWQTHGPQAAPLPQLYKMGEGPLYPFWFRITLCTLRRPTAIARVVPIRGHVAPPLGGPMVEVCAVLRSATSPRRGAGRVRHVYDLREAVNADEMSADALLAEGLFEGCKLMRAIRRIRY